MKVLVKGKNLEVSEALQEYAEKKAAKIAKFFAERPLWVQITIGTERSLHNADVTVQLNDLLLRGEARTTDMYTSIDDAIEKIERQIQKYKTKISHRLHEDYAKVMAKTSGSVREAEEPRILRTKRFAVKPMSVAEAVMQMDLLGHDFFVFSNAETEEVNVVYCRNDGNYGLIEPEF